MAYSHCHSQRPRCPKRTCIWLQSHFHDLGWKSLQPSPVRVCHVLDTYRRMLTRED